MLKGNSLLTGTVAALIFSTQSMAFSFGSSNDEKLTPIPEISDIQVKACMLAVKYHEGDPEIPLQLVEHSKTWKGGQGKTVIVSVDYLRKTELGSSGVGTSTCRFDEADIVNPKYHSPINILRFTAASGGNAPMEYVEQIRNHIKEELEPEKE